MLKGDYIWLGWVVVLGLSESGCVSGEPLRQGIRGWTRVEPRESTD